MEQFFLTRATLDMEEGIRDYLNEFVEYGSNINGTGFFKKILNGRSFREALVRNEYLEDSEYARKTGKAEAEARAREQGAVGELTVTEERIHKEGVHRYGTSWLMDILRFRASTRI